MTYALSAHPSACQVLDHGWQCVMLPPGQVNSPAELGKLPLEWLAAQVPGTLASAQRAAGLFQYGQHAFDQHDAWFRCLHPLGDDITDTEGLLLRFDGLASLADVYWDDELILSSDNMFHAHEVDLQGRPCKGTLHIHFKALSTALAQRRPRPRWKTRLVDQQQLRWLRTTLLGRIPGWSPPVAPVGPYRAISLIRPALVRIEQADLRTRVVGGAGQVEAQLRLHLKPGVDLLALVLSVGDASTPLPFTRGTQDLWQATGQLTLPEPALWWPHTHGTPHRYAAQAVLTTTEGVFTLDLGLLGFRTVHVDQSKGAFTVHINGVPVFCRGACWTPTDLVSLASDESSLRPTLTLARDAGMNMLRVGGTMVYESQVFYTLCDELGILVWQDFMFANMDYPVDDVAFSQSITTEARQFLQRTQSHACLTVLCGNSEVEQQAAMLGLTQAHWRNPFFGEALPALCEAMRPDVQYWPSSPAGGVLPFQVDHAVSHYYGVGAYLRPLEDARRAGVRFTSECLGFANIPDESSVDQLLKHGGQAVHHPVWKQRVPRDNGAGWDFEDVRDHYMAQLFRIDPLRLRYADMARYLALGRVTTGEVIGQTIAEWRRSDASCRGSLVWFLRDFWLGAGWGLIDAMGRPKAAYWYARRAMRPLALHLSDEGNNGLEVHLTNDGPAQFSGVLELTLYRQGEVRVAHASLPVEVAAHGALQVRADALFDHFLDTAYAYRFGPPGHHLAVAQIRPVHQDTAAVAEAFFHTLGLPGETESDLGLQAMFEHDTAEGSWQVTLSTRRFAQSVYLDVPGFLPQDNYFHLAPGASRRILLQAQKPVAKVQGTVAPLNQTLPTRIASAPASRA